MTPLPDGLSGEEKLPSFFQAEDGIRYYKVTGVQTCALPIYQSGASDVRRRSPTWRCIFVRRKPHSLPAPCSLSMAAGQQHNAASSFSKINHGKLDENVLDRAQLNYPAAPAGILYLSSGELLQVSRPGRSCLDV